MQQVYTVEFGPQEAEKVLNTEMTKEEKDIHIKEAKRQREQIKKGYGRIQEKVKYVKILAVQWSMEDEVVVVKLFFNTMIDWLRFMEGQRHLNPSILVWIPTHSIA